MHLVGAEGRPQWWFRPTGAAGWPEVRGFFFHFITPRSCRGPVRSGRAIRIWMGFAMVCATIATIQVHHTTEVAQHTLLPAAASSRRHNGWCFWVGGVETCDTAGALVPGTCSPT